ncbi:MAG: hypothetical protein C4542_05980 [Dehalococcoidia bacterium]|nr:MAG: hypothetical protein C4542_05980 [Dehalococcoidia bacterium]
MPGTPNGIGTSFWGRAEPKANGSYITTEWFTIVIPIIPIKSHRLIPTKRSGSRQEYLVLETFPSVHGKQVKHVYQSLLPFLLVFGIGLYILIEVGFNQNNAVGFIAFMAIFFVSFLLFSFLVNRITY